MKRKRYDDPIPVRVSVEKRAELERDAAARNITVSDLIRERLDLAQTVADQLEALRHDVAFRLGQPSGQGASTPPASPSDGALLEILLLLRAVAGPNRQNIVAGELALHGHRPWTPKETA
jgi:hypothetical protein